MTNFWLLKIIDPLLCWYFFFILLIGNSYKCDDSGDEKSGTSIWGVIRLVYKGLKPFIRSYQSSKANDNVSWYAAGLTQFNGDSRCSNLEQNIDVSVQYLVSFNEHVKVISSSVWTRPLKQSIFFYSLIKSLGRASKAAWERGATERTPIQMTVVRRILNAWGLDR